MRTFLTFLLFTGLALVGFGWWGLFTKSGQAEYPEMAGLIPFYSAGAGVGCILLGGIVHAFRYWRRRRAQATVTK